MISKTDYFATSGAVGLFHNGEWGLLCYNHYSVELGNVICETYNGKHWIPQQLTRSSSLGLNFSHMPVMSGQIKCPATAHHMTDCNVYTTWGRSPDPKYRPPCTPGDTVALKCRKQTARELAFKDAGDLRQENEWRYSIEQTRRKIDELIEYYKRNPESLDEIPVLDVKSKIEEGKKLVAKLASGSEGAQKAAELNRVFFDFQYPQWLKGINQKQREKCRKPGLIFSSCVQCQKRCEHPTYEPKRKDPNRPAGTTADGRWHNCDESKCTSGCVCYGDKWLNPGDTCSKECTVTATSDPGVGAQLMNTLNPNSQRDLASTGGIVCPEGQVFSQCKSHCQFKCGKSAPTCSQEKCLPGCICANESHVMWEDGKTCAPVCLEIKTTLAPTTTTLPKGCEDRITTCKDMISSCQNSEVRYLCAISCKNKEVCGDIFNTTTPPPTYETLVGTRPPATTPSVTKDPKFDCNDNQKQCKTLSRFCGVPGYRVARMCPHTCGMCHKLDLMGAYSSANPRPTTTATTTTQRVIATARATLATLPMTTLAMTLPPMCADIAKNCPEFKDYCSQQAEVRTQCPMTCGTCSVPTIPVTAKPVTAPCPTNQPTMPGQYTPQCDERGFYSAKQCNFSARTCWCVSPHGQESPKTRSFFEDPRLIEHMTCSNENGQLVSNFKGDNVYIMDQNEIDPNTVGELQVEKITESFTKCQEERSDILTNKPGLFAPTCDENGNYIEIQWSVLL